MIELIEVDRTKEDEPFKRRTMIIPEDAEGTPYFINVLSGSKHLFVNTYSYNYILSRKKWREWNQTRKGWKPREPGEYAPKGGGGRPDPTRTGQNHRS